MSEEKISQEFRLKNVDETRNYLTEEINRNELMGKKDKKICTTLNYIEHFLVLAYTSTGCFCFCSWYSYRSYEFCNRTKNVCNNCRN